MKNDDFVPIAVIVSQEKSFREVDSFGEKYLL